MMEFSNGQYTIQGIPVEEICREFGMPLFVYDAGYIAGQVETFRTAFAGVPTRIKYACKASSNITILRLMRKLGTGLDRDRHSVHLYPGRQARDLPAEWWPDRAGDPHRG